MSGPVALPRWVEAAVADGLVARAEWWDEIGSTNNRALELCGDENLGQVARGDGNRGPGAAIVALVGVTRQTAGRGRGANVWWSQPGAMTLSLVIRPTDYGWATSDDPCAAIATATAICRAVEAVIPDAVLGIKWPNDVWCRDRKVGGLLVEPVPGLSGESRLLVVGAGLNVNNRVATGPVAATAISLIEAYGRSGDATAFDLDRLGTAFLRTARHAWRELAGDRARLAAEWRQRCVLSGRRVRIRRGGEVISGRCDGPDDSGGLLLSTDAGRVLVVDGTVEEVAD